MHSRRVGFFSEFSEAPYFTNEMLRQSAEKFQIPKSTFNSYIYKALKEGQILSLKRNFYVTRAFYDKNKTNTEYLFFISNILLKPSYISLEAALQYYGLFAEAVNLTTAVTLKLPREFQNRAGIYTYRKISNKLFTDFQTIGDKFKFTIALRHKAIFDYLYYQTNRFTKNVHPDLLEELRIDTDSLNKEEKTKLQNLIKIFTPIQINL